MSPSISTQIEPSAWERPLLRWAGSKRRLVPTLQSIQPTEWNRYVEPFVGSACLFFALRPSSAILGDRNEHLINAYEILRQHPRLLARQIHALSQSSDEYYRVRAIPFGTLNDFDRAVHFIYLNRLCFNGVYRTNRKGEFNVPVGSNTGGIPSERHFYRCSLALRNAVLNAGDFESTCDLASKEILSILILHPVPRHEQDMVSMGMIHSGKSICRECLRLSCGLIQKVVILCFLTALPSEF